MTVHRIWGYIAPDSGMTIEEVQTEIDDWVAKRTKWPDGDDATVVRLLADPDIGDEEFLRFRVDFEWDSADKDNTLQKCADKFKTKVAWFALVYHGCVHDADVTDGVFASCGWDERWNWSAKSASMPASVDQRVPDAEKTVEA